MGLVGSDGMWGRRGSGSDEGLWGAGKRWSRLGGEVVDEGFGKRWTGGGSVAWEFGNVLVLRIRISWDRERERKGGGRRTR
jgi:hypothetical protein